MNILAIDTATEVCSVALLSGEQTFSDRVIAPQGHTKLLLDMCTNLLNQANIKKSEIDYIACGMGPGSFTGVRIGVGAAQGLSLGLNIKLIPVSNLQILAQGSIRISSCPYIAVAADAKMGEVYLGLFKNQNGIAEPMIDEQVCSPQKALEILEANKVAKEWTATGSGFKAYSDLENFISKNNVNLSADLLPYSLDILPIAIQHVEKAVFPEDVVPTYLRNEVAWKKTSEQKKKS